MRFSELIPVIQMAVGPVILISGVGLLLLSMTNRFARVIDRSRALAAALRDLPQNNAHATTQTTASRERLALQLQMLRRRANLLRTSITLATISVLLAALLVITIFITALLQSDSALAVIIFFLACMFLLILSLIFFLQDLNLSLEAMKLDVAELE
jgi:hypothetical protein